MSWTPPKKRMQTISVVNPEICFRQAKKVMT